MGQSVEFFFRICNARKYQQIKRNPHTPAARLAYGCAHVVKRIARGPIVAVVQLCPGAVEAHAHAGEARLCKANDGISARGIGIAVHRAGALARAELPHALDQQVGIHERITFAALTKGINRRAGFAPRVDAHDLGNFLGARRKGKAALRRGLNGRILFLRRDTANAAGIARPRRGQRGLKAAKGKVARRRAIVARHAVIHNMPDKPVLGVIAQQGAGALLNAATRNIAENLPGFAIHPAGADIEPPPGKAHGPVSKQGQHGRVFAAFIGGMGRKRVAGGSKGRYGKLGLSLRGGDASGFGVKAHSLPARQQKELAFLRQGNQLQLLTTSDDVMQALIRDIQLARHNIEMVFYIWQPGGMADQVAESLMAAARRGIHCRLMLDSAGSVAFFRSPWAGMMRNAGIEVVEALKVNLLRVFLRRMDLRQHRKMIMIDNYIAYTGSMNMVDPRFFKQDSGVGQWVDLMARMEGPIATSMGIVYSCDWEIETGKRILPPPPDGNIMPFEEASGHTIHTIASGPGFPEDLIHQALLTATYSAREYLIMTTPYFVPSDDLLHAICTAAQRGVDVSIILPRKNDSLLVGWASRAFFSELLAAGVKIYQFEGGLLHTKSVLVDGELSLVGTVNLDMRSLWLNFEITLVIDDAGFGGDLAAVQDDYISRSRLLDARLWVKRPLWQRIAERLFYFFSPLL